jgi:hypothetical protein
MISRMFGRVMARPWLEPWSSCTWTAVNKTPLPTKKLEAPKANNR